MLISVLQFMALNLLVSFLPFVLALGHRLKRISCVFTRRKISEFNAIVEDRIYVLFAVVEGLVEGEDWWYPACRCHRSVTPDSGAYYCKRCVKHVFHMVPRLS